MPVEEDETCSKLHWEWRNGSSQRWGKLPQFGKMLHSPVPSLVSSPEVDTLLPEKLILCCLRKKMRSSWFLDVYMEAQGPEGRAGGGAEG